MPGKFLLGKLSKIEKKDANGIQKMEIVRRRVTQILVKVPTKPKANASMDYLKKENVSGIPYEGVLSMEMNVRPSQV
jgi:hypothetical protein